MNYRGTSFIRFCYSVSRNQFYFQLEVSAVVTEVKIHTVGAIMGMELGGVNAFHK